LPGASALGRGDKWHLDEVMVTTNGRKHWLWRAVDRHGALLDVLVQGRDQARSQATHAQAAQEARSRAARTNHRQAQELRGSKQGSRAEREHR